MSKTATIGNSAIRHPSIAAAAYAALIIALFSTSVFTLVDLGEQYGGLARSKRILARLEQAAQVAGTDTGQTADDGLSGSPFLEGATVTLASAALLQRIRAAVGRIGGTVVSTEVESQGEEPKDNYVRVIANCELEQGNLQQLLYDIEAGMPILFVNQLVAQGPVPPGGSERIRILLGVSGLWRQE
jgi:general secretion pathway protein M